MTKYLFKRLLHGLLSIIAVVTIVMLLIYSLMDREQIFMADTQYSKKTGNQQIHYQYTKWEAYGYLDYVRYEDYISTIYKEGKITEAEKKQLVSEPGLGKKEAQDTAIVKRYVKEFTQYYEKQGYTVERHDYITKSKQAPILIAHKDISVFVRLFKYFTSIISIDNIHYVERNVKDSNGDLVSIDNIGLTFSLYDPAYNTTQSGFKIYTMNSGNKSYLSFDKNGISFESSISSLYTWDNDIYALSTIDGTNAYYLGVDESNNVICDEKSTVYGTTSQLGTSRFVLSFDTESYPDYNSFDNSAYYVLNATVSEVKAIRKDASLKLYYITTANSVDTYHYLVLNNGQLSITLNENEATLFNFEFIQGGEIVQNVFSPCIIGNGTKNKYLLYFDNQFPFIHQNIISITLGESYSVNKDVDIFNTLFDPQDPNMYVCQVFPTGNVMITANDIHTMTYSYGVVTGDNATPYYTNRFIDDYANIKNIKSSASKTGFSFIIGIISTICAYILGIPLGIIMARKKDKLVDKIGTLYVIFIIAVPSLAYIFMFKAIGISVFNLPAAFDATNIKWTMYVLPIISLALPMVANLMKWIRRYMIDQMNSDYVKFARSGGLSEKEIFNKHILKNAIIPIVQGIPGSLISSLFGAIITERIYLVPGAGYLLTQAINKSDNAVIVGLTFYFAIFSILSLILGDILMSVVDPRISFTEKAR